MPIDAVITSGWKMYVVNAGSDDVSVIDVARKTAVAHISVGSNPRGIVLSPDERFAYVNNMLSGTISVIDTATDRVTAQVVSTRIALPPDILNGKILFNTSARTSLAKDCWISCATCHFEGGTDGRTWFFRDGLRNTPALFGLAETLPMHWSGDLDELEDVESTVRVVQAGTGLADGPSNCEPACDQALPNHGRSADLDDLAAFMRTLRFSESNAPLDAAATRGSSLFFSPATRCAECHPAPLFTDRQKHDVGTGRNLTERKGTSFDTPSLRALASTAPYLHDGSAATLLDVLTAANGDGLHGTTSHLSAQELSDLAAFLERIPTQASRRRAAGR